MGIAMVGRNRRSVLAAALVLVVLAASLVLAGARRGAAAAADTTPPVLVSLTMTPGTIDTSNGPVTITAEARVTDASGLSIGGRVPLSRLVLTGPGGQQHATAYLSQAQRVSGSALDGIYDTTLIVPWHAEPGHWSASVVLVDIYGNTATLAAADLASAGLPSGIVQTGPGDTTAPSLVSLSIAPGSVDTSLAPATIVVSARVIDDLAGVSDGVGVAPSQVVLRGPTGAHHARATLDVTHRVAGNSLDATYSVPVILPRWSEQGTWVVESVTLVDEVGNTATVGAPGVSFSQTGIGDIVPPRFRSFSLSTSNVDVRSAAANITMQARIVDDRSGVAQGLTDSPSEVVFDSPSGRQEVVAVFGLAQLVLGNGLDGTYSQVVSIPAHAEPGAWTLRLGWAVDQAGNSISLSATDWSAAGFPSSFTVVSDTPPDTGPTLPPAPSTSSTTFAGGITSTTDTAPDTSSSTTSTSLAPDSSTTATSSVPADSSTSTTTSTVAPDSSTTSTSLAPDSSTTTTSSTPIDSATTTTSTTPIDSSTTTSTGPDTTTTAATITTTASTTTVAAGGSTTTSTTTVAAGGSTTTTTTTTTTPVAASGRATVADGYWFVASTGSVAGFGGAARSAMWAAVYGPAGQAVGMAPTPSGNGYWIVAADGDVRAFGDAQLHGSMYGYALAKPIVGMAATPSGKGYWLVASDGGIFSFGDARFYGSTGAMRLNQPIVGMASSPSGKGYWFVASDGGIFAFGDARFYGSTGAMRLNQPIVGMAASRTGHGYWLVASDGGIFSFGDTRFYGSTGAMRLNQPIVGMAATPTNHGYWFVASDGGIFSFGDARFFGSLGGRAASAPPVVGMAAHSR